MVYVPRIITQKSIWYFKKLSKTAVAELIKLIEFIEFIEGIEFTQEVGGQAIKIIHTASFCDKHCTHNSQNITQFGWFAPLHV